jgi:RNA polymerase sigma-70 factor (ECF subfamily)
LPRQIVPDPDLKLLERARRGDSAAFGAMVRPLIPRVRRFAQSFAHQGVDADDLAQEALLKAYRSIGSFEGRSKLSTWLYSITRTVGLDLIRSRQHRDRQADRPLPDELPDESESQEALLQGKNEADLLWAALRRLDPEYRVAIVLADVEGLSFDEIAEIEGIPVGTAKSRASRGRDRLASLLRRVEGLTVSATAEANPSSQGQQGSSR